MKCASIIRICILFSLICLAFSFIFILHCPDAKFAGLNVNTTDSISGLRFRSDCNAECLCSHHNYDPICGLDNTIYFSPCFAGCENVYQQVETKGYGSCKCIKHPGMNMTFGGVERLVEATREKCSNNCLHGPLFLAVIFFCMFFTFLVSMPSLSATLRCVAETQKSFGLGIQWMAVRILGTIPAPVLFGWLIDQSCILWQDSCDQQQGSCLFYNNEMMSTNILVIVVLVKFLTCVFFFIAWYTYRPADRVASPLSTYITDVPSGDPCCVGIRYVVEDTSTTCHANTSSVF